VDDSIAEKHTGMTREQVLAGIASGDIHPNGREVAWFGISPQAIAFACKGKEPRVVIGGLPDDCQIDEQPPVQLIKGLTKPGSQN